MLNFTKALLFFTANIVAHHAFLIPMELVLEKNPSPDLSKHYKILFSTNNKHNQPFHRVHEDSKSSVKSGNQILGMVF